MRDLIKGLRKIEYKEVCLSSAVQVGSDLVGEGEKLGLTTASRPEAMLRISEDVML